MSTNLANLLYLIPIVAFILALRFLSSPAHARRGNQIGAVGMLVAIVVTWVKTGGTSWGGLAPRLLGGGGLRAGAARRGRGAGGPRGGGPLHRGGGGAGAP